MILFYPPSLVATHLWTADQGLLTDAINNKGDTFLPLLLMSALTFIVDIRGETAADT